ncbi:MAG: hypothetical protein PVF75_09185 [Granulosicoccaceae bacterium]|jgi:thiol-disulfide isomerase/thioredoxin
MRHLIPLLVLLCHLPGLAGAQQGLPESTWLAQDEQGRAVIQVYFFWSYKCPHCLEALPYIEQLAANNGDIELHSLQLVGEHDNVARYQHMASALGQTAQSVPAFLFCNSMQTGYSEKLTPGQIERTLSGCRQYLAEHGKLQGFKPPPARHVTIDLPLFGPVSTGEVDGLPVITLLIAAVDAFNPCAFFVLMFLLSLMLHTGSRRRMFIVGGVFVFFSGLMYFLFMSAWLNLFRVIGQLHVITLVAGLVAIVIGAINIKDFIWFRRGISLTISDAAKPALYQRARRLLRADSLSTLLLATVGLALFANLYEFLCTAGFPMVYTRILTLVELPEWQYYAYLVLYNMVYILPLLTIVLLFAWGMGGRKLQENEGRRLKLVSGVMMATLGLMLLFAPDLLQNLAVAGTLLVTALLISAVLIHMENNLSAGR